MDIAILKNQYSSVKEQSISGRYLPSVKIESLLNKWKRIFKIEVVGRSVNGLPISKIEIGKGPIKLLMWSQMHGNESTTTKAVFDLLNFLNQDSVLAKSIKSELTIVIIPQLNPDGANAYTRINANKVDLNRDAQNLTQPESKVLRALCNSFKPHFCFNLHGQRTIFSAGETNNIATLSFLAPSADKDRSITSARVKAMGLISYINNNLQTLLKNQIGRYDDGFNANCVGDTFIMNEIPTLLFETGHYINDYKREEVRLYAFLSILKGIEGVLNKSYLDYDVSDYETIPNNGKCFYDVWLKDVIVNEEKKQVLIQYTEELQEGAVVFKPFIVDVCNSYSNYAHRVLDGGLSKIEINCGKTLKIGDLVDELLVDNVKVEI